MRHRADQEPIEILLIFFTICLIQVADSWGKDRKGLFDMGWNGNQAVGPPDPSTLLAIQDGNNITTVDSPRNFQKNGYEWIVGLRFFTLLVILHLLNYFFCP